MSFPRHGEIYPCDEGAIVRPHPRPSRWMSLQPVIPGGLLSSRARVRFTGRCHARSLRARKATQIQQTVNCDLSGCLSGGVHRTLCLCDSVVNQALLSQLAQFLHQR
jgi:hypothetical protein